MVQSVGVRVHALGLLAGACALACVFSAAAAEGGPRFIGPLASPAPTLPAGAGNIEPYLVAGRTSSVFDGSGDRHAVDAPTSWSLLLPMQYGLTDWLTLGLTVRGAFDTTQDGSRRDLSLGDSTVSALVGLYDGAGPSRMRVAAGVRRGLATGRHDQLQPEKQSGNGSGADTTTLALQSQMYAHDGFLRLRAAAAWRLPGAHAQVQGASVYGTTAGFQGRATLGAGLVTTASAEYSISPRWTLVGEAMYERNSGTRVSGVNADGSVLADAPLRSWRASLLPAVQYHFSDAVGVIAGVQVPVAGRNTANTVAPQVAVNIGF